MLKEHIGWRGLRSLRHSVTTCPAFTPVSVPAVANIASSSRVTIAYMLPEYTDVLIFTWFWRTITVSRSLRLLW